MTREANYQSTVGVQIQRREVRLADLMLEEALDREPIKGTGWQLQLVLGLKRLCLPMPSQVLLLFVPHPLPAH